MRIEPTSGAVDGLSKHIRETLRAFPVADLAKALLRGRDRYEIVFHTDSEDRKLYHCPADGSLWLSREEAIAHVLRGEVLTKFYDVEEVDSGTPSGNFSVVAVCGMSGEILGPPNHHEYQRNVARLHAERFSNMPLERYKSRIVMESGEEAIERWKQKVSKTFHYRVKEGDSEDEKEEEVSAGGAEQSEGETGMTVESPGEIEPSSGGNAMNEESPAEDSGAQEQVPEEASPTDTDTDTDTDTPEGNGEIPADGEALAESVTDPEKPEEKSSEEENSGDEDDSDSGTEENSAGAQEGDSEDTRVVLKTPEELSRHFRDHFAEEAIAEVREAVVPGDIPGNALSRPLLSHVRQETEGLRRGFPLPMVQALCREFEKRGLRFFKRGKKALHVSLVRPRPLGADVSLTEQVQKIVDLLVEKDSLKVVDLLDALVEDFSKPEKGTPPESLELSDAAKSVLKDLRWLTSEGFVLEFADTRVALGKPPRKDNPKKSSGKAVAAGKEEAEKKAKPEEGEGSSQPGAEEDCAIGSASERVENTEPEPEPEPEPEGGDPDPTLEEEKAPE